MIANKRLAFLAGKTVHYSILPGRLAFVLIVSLFGAAALIVFPVVPGVAAEPESLSVRTPEKRIVRVGYYPFDGFLMTDSQGKRSGYGYDYLQELRNYTNWTYEYSDPKYGWSEMLSMLRDGTLDMVPGVSRTPEREKEFAFSRYPLVRVSSLMTVKAGNSRYRAGDYAHWNGIRVGLLKNATQSGEFTCFAKEKGFSFTPVWFEHAEQMINALQTGNEIDAVVSSSLRNIGGNEWLYEQFNVLEMHLAVRRNDSALLNELDRAMELLETYLPEFQEQLRRHYYTHKESGILSFSEPERTFLDHLKSSGQVFTCLLNPDRKPFSWIENGSFRGIFREYADEIAKRTGLTLRFIPVQTREEYAARRTSPEIDIVFDALMDRYQAERDGFRLTQPYFSVSVSQLRAKNAGNTFRTVSVLSPGDLAGRVPAILPKNVSVRFCKSTEELVNSVKNAESDAAYLYTRSAEYAVYADEHNQLVSNYVPSLGNSFAIGVRDSLNPLLLSIINKAVLSLDEPFANQMRTQYSPKFKEVFSLNQFVHSHPLLTLGTPIAMLSLLCLFFCYVLSRRKRNYQTGLLFSKLPLRCFVLNEQGEFLHYTLGQRSKLSEAPVLRGIDDIPDEAVRKLLREKVSSVLRTGTPEIAEFSFDGSYRSAIISKLPDSAFGENTALWISQDITELQQSRDEIRKHEEFFRLTLDSIGDGAITTDAEGKILLLNPVAEQLIGISSAEAKGKPHEEIFRIVCALDGKTVESPLRKSLNTGKIIELGNHTDLLSFDGRRYHISDCAGPIRDRGGVIIGAILIFRDVTEAYAQREALRESVANWEAASDIARICSYRVNIRTSQALGNLKRLDPFWKIVDGKAFPVEEWVAPEDLPEFKRLFTEFRNGAGNNFVATYRAGQPGALRHFRLFGRMDENDPEIMTGLIQDVTELFEAVAELNESTLMWKNVMEELPVLFFVKDANNHNRYLMCNKKNAEFLGVPAEDVIGKTTQEIRLPSAELKQYLDSEKHILGNNATNRSRANIPAADGFLREMEKIEMTVSGRNGKKLLVGIAFDVTEREQNLRLSAISTRLLSEIVVEPDFDNVLHLVAKATLEILSCRRVIFAKTDENGQLRFYKECENDGIPRSCDARTIALHGKVWNTYLDRLNNRELICFDRLGDDPVIREEFKAYPEYAETSLAAVPIFMREKMTGVIIVSFNTPRHFTEIETKILHTIADCLQIAEIRAGQECEIRRNQRDQAHQLADRTAINNCLRIFMNSNYMEVPFEQILEIIRKHLGASHCYALRVDPKSGLETCFAETTAEGVPNLLKDKPPVPFEPEEFWYRELQKKGVIPWTDLSREETRATGSFPWQHIMDENKIHSVWEAALTPGGEMWGTLGILYQDQTERKFSLEDEGFVRSAARLVSLILMRCMSRDKLIQARDELSCALEQAQTAEKAKSYFLASMSHEIRTPLNAVIGFTELMKDSAMDHDAQQDCLENIYSSGNALLQLINDILDLSKLEAEQMPIILESTNFPEFCNEVCRPFLYSASQKMLNLFVKVPESMPPLMLDQLRIRQILFNLIGNAIKFTKEGFVRVMATFTQSSVFEGSLLLQIVDTGIGIDEEDQKKLFEPFVQLSKMRGTNASNSGTGLGLAIVRKLVDKMGGSMTLESTEGQGSTFSILLPQVRIAEGNSAGTGRSRKEIKPVKQRRPASSESGIANGTGLRVLVVDDVPLNVKILSTMLKRLNANVTAADSGKMALEKLKEGPFDWVLTDYLMDGMNGAELAEVIRGESAWKTIRLAVVTAEYDTLPFDRDLFDKILRKPVSTQKLQECLFGRAER